MWIPKDSAILMTSAVYKLKSRCLNTEPCGRPYNSEIGADLTPVNTTVCILFVRKETTQLSAVTIGNSTHLLRAHWSKTFKIIIIILFTLSMCIYTFTCVYYFWVFILYMYLYFTWKNLIVFNLYLSIMNARCTLFILQAKWNRNMR